MQSDGATEHTSPASDGGVRLVAARAAALAGCVSGLVWLGLSMLVLVNPRGEGVERGFHIGVAQVTWLLGLTGSGVLAVVVASCGWIAFLRSGDRRWKLRSAIAAPFAAVCGLIWFVTLGTWGGFGT